MKFPFIIIVDDDEHVLRAIQRDVRNEYREMYRVSATDSALEAIELVKELKQKNETELNQIEKIKGIEFFFNQKTSFIISTIK